MTRRRHLFPHAAILLLGWGAFAFGSEFTWAYAALLTFSVAVSALGFLAGARRSESTFSTYRPLILALALLFGATVVQIVPLPPSVITAVSPARNNADYARLYAERDRREVPSTAQGPARTLSIEPSRSLVGMTFLAALSLLLIGSARGFEGVRPTSVVRGIIVLGVIGAFAEIIQKASGSLEIYGLFMPRQMRGQSAPFINRNHTAGWLLMILALGLGYLLSCLARGMREVKPDWRSRLLWFSTPDAAEAVLSASAVAMIAVAIIVTQSRSGALCLVLVLTLFAWLGANRLRSRTKKALLIMNLAVVLTAAALIGGADAVIRRFGTVSAEAAFDRPAIWRDAMGMVRDFPIAGTGLNTYGIASLRYQTIQPGVRFIEAHNDYLQLLSEGGLLLGLPAILAMLAAGKLVRRRFASGEDDQRQYWLRVGAVVGICAISTQSLFDFTLQMPGAAALFAVFVAMAIHRRWRPAATLPLSG